jgi:tetratricopeptide (TPR) repeat protein
MLVGINSMVQQARALCDESRWAEALALTRRWQMETSEEPLAFYYEGLALTGLGKCVAAETAYYRALALDDQNFTIWNSLASLMFEGLKQPEAGAKCLAEAMHLDPGNKHGWAKLAGMYVVVGRHAEAVECAERALALDPEMVEAQLHRGRAGQALGRTELVRSACEALAKLSVDKFHPAE